jgi:hypothetical protein
LCVVTGKGKVLECDRPGGRIRTCHIRRFINVHSGPDPQLAPCTCTSMSRFSAHPYFGLFADLALLSPVASCVCENADVYLERIRRIPYNKVLSAFPTARCLLDEPRLQTHHRLRACRLREISRASVFAQQPNFMFARLKGTGCWECYIALSWYRGHLGFCVSLSSILCLRGHRINWRKEWLSTRDFSARPLQAHTRPTPSISSMLLMLLLSKALCHYLCNLSYWKNDQQAADQFYPRTIRILGFADSPRACQCVTACISNTIVRHVATFAFSAPGQHSISGISIKLPSAKLNRKQPLLRIMSSASVARSIAVVVGVGNGALDC